MALLVGELYGKLGLDDSEFHSKLGNAESHFSHAGGGMTKAAGMLGGILTTAGGFLAANVIGGIASQFAGLASGMVSGNAEFESYEASFATLMGSADAAKAKIAELGQFAATTPFELPEVVQASKNLLTFGGAALNTTENMNIVGNAAAATGQKVNEVGFWYGRAASLIQGGKTFGEAAARLQEMGIMSSTARDKIEKMQASGAKAPAVWKAFQESLTAPTDGMEKLGKTFQGQMGTLNDNMAAFGRTAGKPIFDALKNLATAFNSPAIQGGFQKVATLIADVLGKAITWLSNTAIPAMVNAWKSIAPVVSRAFSSFQTAFGVIKAMGGVVFGYGQNIGVQFGNGIAASVAYVVNGLRAIAKAVTYWLRPHSPPKILPNLDTWGTDAANVYMEGWTQADFSAFDELGGKIKDAIDGMVKSGGMAGVDAIPMFANVQASLAKAMDELKKTGDIDIAGDAYKGLMSSLGPVQPEIKGLIDSYVKLRKATAATASAQTELNDTTKKYDETLAPLNAQMKQIEDKKQAIEDNKKLAELKAKIADGETSDQDRALAQLEIEEITLRQQIDTVEDSKDAAVSAAEAKLTAAEAAQTAAEGDYQAQQAVIEAHQKQNDLMVEQRNLVDQLAKAKADAAAAGGAGGGGAGGGGGGGMPSMDIPMPEAGAGGPDLGDPAATIAGFRDGVNTQLEQMQAETAAKTAGIMAGISASFAPLVEMGTTLFAPLVANIDIAWAGVSTIFERRSPEIAATFGNTWEILKEVVIDRFNVIVELIGAAMGIIGTVIAEYGPRMADTFISAVLAIVDGATGAFAAVQGVITTVMGFVASFLQQNGGSIAAFIGTTWIQIMQIVTAAVTIVSMIVEAAFTTIDSFLQAHGDTIINVLSNTWTIISTVVTQALSLISGILTATMQALQGDWGGAWTTIQTMSVSFVGAIGTVIMSFLDLIANFFGTTLTGIGTLWSSNWAMLQKICDDAAAAIFGTLDKWGDSIMESIRTTITTIKGLWSSFSGEATSIGTNIINGIKKGMENAKGQLVDFIIKVCKDSLDAIKSFFGIHSPSKRMGSEVGEPMIAGLIVGMESMLTPLIASINHIGDEVMKAFEKVTDRINKMIDDTITDALTGASSIASQRSANLKDLQDLMPDPVSDEDMAKMFPDVDADAIKDKYKLTEADIKKAFPNVSKDIRDALLQDPEEVDLDKLFPVKEAFSAAEASSNEAKRQQEIANFLRMQNSLRADQQKLIDTETASQESARQKKIDDFKATQAAITSIAQQAKTELEQAEMQAGNISQTDAEAGAKYLKMRSDQIFAMAQEQKALASATTDHERKEIQARIDLLKQQQSAEQSVFMDSTKHAGDEAQDTLDELQKESDDLKKGLEDAKTKRADLWEKENTLIGKKLELDGEIPQTKDRGDREKLIAERTKIMQDLVDVTKDREALDAQITGYGPAISQIDALIANYSHQMTSNFAVLNELIKQMTAGITAPVPATAGNVYNLYVTSVAETPAVIREFNIMEARG